MTISPYPYPPPPPPKSSVDIIYMEVDMNMIRTHGLEKCKRILISAKLDEAVGKQELFDWFPPTSNLRIWQFIARQYMQFYIYTPQTQQQTTNFYDKLFPES